MSAELNKARQRLVDEYLNALQEDVIPWHQEWASGKAINGITKKPYNGMNQLLLSHIAYINNYNDPRWMTLHQANEKGWRIKAGAKGTLIEFWSLYDELQRKNISIKEANDLISADESRRAFIKWKVRNYTVFNGEQITGIPKYEEPLYKIKDPQPFIDTLIQEMGVTYIEEGGRAYYSPGDDSVHIPPSELFEDNYSYQTTRLHELSHATGHSSRLNRQLSNGFGTTEYAKEELRAEIASSFIAADLQLQFDQKHLNNHKAYIQSWISILQNDPNELFRAIKDANSIYDYVAKTGHLEIYQLKEGIINDEILEDRINTLVEDGLIDQNTADLIMTEHKEAVLEQLKKCSVEELKSEDIWFAVIKEVAEDIHISVRKGR